MLKKLLTALRGCKTFDAVSACFNKRDGELTLVTQVSIPRGQRLLVQFPDGKTVSGQASWGREMTPEQGQGHLLGVSVLQELETYPAQSRSVSHGRRSERHSLRQWVSFPKLKGLGAVTTDLSLEGCRLATDLTGRVGEVHTINLDLPATSIAVDAKIVWSRQGQTGLRFLNLHLHDEAVLARFLGMPSPARMDSTENVWRRSTQALTFRVTEGVAEGMLVLEFETENWLVKYELENATAMGDLTGAFSKVEIVESSPRILALRQKCRLRLNSSSTFVHLRLLAENGDTVLDVLGLEQSFSRSSRTLTCRL